MYLFLNSYVFPNLFLIWKILWKGPCNCGCSCQLLLNKSQTLSNLDVAQFTADFNQ